MVGRSLQQFPVPDYNFLIQLKVTCNESLFLFFNRILFGGQQEGSSLL